MKNLIVDCYTDEPSGLGAPPYLSVHSRYLAGALKFTNQEYEYINIDDLRFASGEEIWNDNTLNKRVINHTKEISETENILLSAERIFVIMGCFVDYSYLSCEPPTFTEIEKLLSSYRNKEIILMYALGSKIISKEELDKALPKNLFDKVIFGNFYNYILFGNENDYLPHYEVLSKISVCSADIVKRLPRPLIYEIETATGCNRKPGCKFCIESIRGINHTSRPVDDIVAEMKSLYSEGVRYFRLGRQPNFFAYFNTSPNKVEELFQKIWTNCPEIKVLHIDNVSPHNVNTSSGKKIAEIVAKYCTSGNIAPFGVESFDPKVRSINNLNGSVEDIMKSIEIINEVGSKITDEGTRQFLPGINIIYGLEGQSEDTLQYNLEAFSYILEHYYVRRIFVRNLTSPHGELFGEKQKSGFETFRTKIVDKFSLPMLKKVYPMNTILKHERVEMVINGNSILRQMGTCPERVVVKNKILNLDDFYTIKIVGYISDRVLMGEIICKE